MQARSRGGKLQMVYSPVDAVELAKVNPSQEVVFFAVGFETTAPATALAVIQAAELSLPNFTIVPAHVRVLPAMETIMAMPDNRVEGFLAAGHVCSITGFDLYEAFCSKHRVPVVVTGFEPTDLLEGILRTVTLLESSQAVVENR
jgi:hydrogenase expression/formation protein HypD